MTECRQTKGGVLFGWYGQKRNQLSSVRWKQERRIRMIRCESVWEETGASADGDVYERRRADVSVRGSAGHVVQARVLHAGVGAGRGSV